MSDSVRGRRRRYILVLMALTALTLATLDKRQGDSGPIGAAGRLAHNVVQPVSNGAHSAFSPVQDWWSGLWHRGDVVAENRRLREMLEAEIAQNDARDNAIEENKRYKQFFNDTYWSDYKQIGATVTADSPGNNETTATINRGREAGIRDGMAVVGQRGLIGIVTETWNGGSKVLLITDPSFGVAARTLIDKRFGTAQTDDDGVLRMAFAANSQPNALDVQIKEGDEIVTCGCNKSDLPAGIPVGKVSDVSVAVGGSNVRVAVTPTLDRKSLNEVKVILWSPGDETPAKVTDELVQGENRTTTTTRGATGTTTTTVGK